MVVPRRSQVGLMHRFFVLRTGSDDEPWAVDTELTLTPEDAAHAARVLRLRTGQSVLISDGQGFDYEATLTDVSPKSVRARLTSVGPSPGEPRLFLTLVQGIAKGSKMDFIIQKAVELGVARIIPVDTERTVVRLTGAKAAARVERWQRIAYEAAKQAGRGRIPRIEDVHPWTDVWERDDLGFAVVPWEAEAGQGLVDVVRQGVAKDAGNGAAAEASPVVPSVTVAIGPEGGLSEGEVKLAQRRGARPVTLGPRILRTETAAIVATALVLGALNELG